MDPLIGVVLLGLLAGFAAMMAISAVRTLLKDHAWKRYFRSGRP
jgi:hypothetical protein